MKVLSPQIGMATYAGAGRYDYELLSALQRQGHHIFIIMPSRLKGKEPVPTGSRVWWIPARWTWHAQLASLPFFLPVLLAAIRFKPDLIRVHSPYCLGLAALAVGRILNIPTIVHFHHSFERFRGAVWTERELLSRFTHVITVSEFSKRQLSDMSLRASEKCSVIYDGVSTPFSPSQADMSNWKYTHGLSPNQPVFSYVGSLIPRKNVNWLIGLVDEWFQDGGDGALVAIGDGQERENLAHQIAGLGLSDRIHLWGRVDDETLISLLQASNAFLFPSLMEGFGLAPTEALACGTPVIVSNRGALPEVVRHGYTGFVLPLEHGYKPWLEAMHALIANPSLQASMATTGIADVRERFNWDCSARLTAEVYEKVIRDYRFQKLRQPEITS